MRSRSALPLLALALVFASAPAIRADDAELAERVAELERLYDTVATMEKRIHELENEPTTSPAAGTADDWARRVRVSGSANLTYLAGEDESLFDEGSSDVWDTRFFIEADLAEDAKLGDATVFQNASLFFEWDLVRLGRLTNQVGELYVDLRGVLDRDWLNMQVGRFQIPFGEAYQRYSAGYASKPFISNPVAGLWFPDEGIRVFGRHPSGRFGYVASVTGGDNAFNGESDEDKQLSLKLFVEPAERLRLSVSALRTGELGSASSPASSAIWFGEGWGRALGSGTGVATYDHGAIIAPGPNQLRNMTALGADAIFSLSDLARVWMSYGTIGINSQGPSVYDRDLHFWIAELVLEGAALSTRLDPLYIALRANGVGTYDDDEGYLLDVRRGSSLGYNMESFEAYSIAAGLPLTGGLTLRAEYTRQDIDLVRGVTAAIRNAASRSDYYGMEVGVRF